MAQVTGGLESAVGVYHVAQQSFAAGLRSFNRDQFPEARMAFNRADPAVRDARTQFYIAYSYYRQGWDACITTIACMPTVFVRWIGRLRLPRADGSSWTTQ